MVSDRERERVRKREKERGIGPQLDVWKEIEEEFAIDALSMGMGVGGETGDSEGGGWAMVGAAGGSDGWATVAKKLGKESMVHQLLEVWKDWPWAASTQAPVQTRGRLAKLAPLLAVVRVLLPCRLPSVGYAPLLRPIIQASSGDAEAEVDGIEGRSREVDAEDEIEGLDQVDERDLPRVQPLSPGMERRLRMGGARSHVVGEQHTRLLEGLANAGHHVTCGSVRRSHPAHELGQLLGTRALQSREEPGIQIPIVEAPSGKHIGIRHEAAARMASQ